MFVTHIPRGAKPQVKGVKGRPSGQTSNRFRTRLGGYIHTLVQRRILCPTVGGNREGWLAGHVDGHPVVHHLHTNLINLVEAPLYPYIRIPMVEFTHTTLLL
jgi:hypothetical protein